MTKLISVLLISLTMGGVEPKGLSSYNKNLRKSFNKYSVAKKTKPPTRFPTSTPTTISDTSNCIQWTCVEWCKFYDKVFEYEYVKYGCVDDGDYCICE